MIHSVRGTLIHIEPRLAVVECGGVGMACQITMNTARQLPAQGDEVMDAVGAALPSGNDVMDLDGLGAVAQSAAPTVPAVDVAASCGADVCGHVVFLLSDLSAKYRARARAAGDPATAPTGRGGRAAGGNGGACARGAARRPGQPGGTTGGVHAACLDPCPVWYCARGNERGGRNDRICTAAATTAGLVR